jgi:hypothetical protein
VLVVLAIGWQFHAPLVGRVYHFEDIAAYFEPLWTAAARQMRLGSLPSWELGAWSGLPLLRDPQVGALYPPNWLWLVLSPLRVYAWLQLAHALFGAFGMWALCRARGRSREAAALAALGLGLGAFVVLEARHAMFVATTAWLPWLMWSIERYAKEHDLQHLVAMAGSAAMTLLAGGWSMLYFGAVVVLILAASRLADADRGTRLRLLGGFAAAGAIGVALAAVQLWPALAHARQSPRALGVDYAFASSYAWPSWRYALTLVFPTLFGSTARGTYVGAPDQWELAGYGIGFLATVWVPLSLVWRERRGERIALLVASLVACDLARGDGGLLHPIFFKLVPMYGSLRCPARALYVWTLTAPLLAADGLDVVLSRVRERSRAVVGALVVGAVAVELLITFRADNPSVRYAEATRRPAAVDWLRAQPGRRIATDVHLGQAFHNAGLSWGVEDAVGYSSLPIWRYLHFLWIANHGRVYPHAKLADDLTAQGLWRWGSRLVDLLSVSWVVAPHDRPITERGFSLAFTGPDGIDVWQNAHAYPRGFVVYRALTAHDGDEAARLLAAPDFSPAHVAILEKAQTRVPPPRPGEKMPTATQNTSVVREGATDLAFEVVMRAPGIFVVAEPWYPGWTVEVDGMPAELLRVDYALRGVLLEAGRHEIAMTFYDWPLVWGGVITVTALALLIGLAWLARARRRNASRAS